MKKTLQEVGFNDFSNVIKIGAAIIAFFVTKYFAVDSFEKLIYANLTSGALSITWQYVWRSFVFMIIGILLSYAIVYTKKANMFVDYLVSAFGLIIMLIPPLFFIVLDIWSDYLIAFAISIILFISGFSFNTLILKISFKVTTNMDDDEIDEFLSNDGEKK